MRYWEKIIRELRATCRPDPDRRIPFKGILWDWEELQFLPRPYCTTSDLLLYEEEEVAEDDYRCRYKCPICGGTLDEWREVRRYGNGPYRNHEKGALEELLLREEHFECCRKLLERR